MTWSATWCATRLEDVYETGPGVHVHPEYEVHDISPACWCAPKRLDDVEVYPIWLHNDLLNREGPADPEATT